MMNWTKIELSDESIELKWMAPEEQGPVPMMGYIVQFQILTADKVAAASGMIYIEWVLFFDE